MRKSVGAIHVASPERRRALFGEAELPTAGFVSSTVLDAPPPAAAKIIARSKPTTAASGTRPYASEIAEFEAFNKKLDSIFEPTREMKALDAEHAKLVERKAATRERLIHEYDVSVRKPIFDNIQRQMAHGGASGAGTISLAGGGAGTTSMDVFASAAAGSMRASGVLGSEKGSSFTSTAKLRSTIPGELWTSASERVHLYTRDPACSGVSGKQLVSTMKMDHFTPTATIDPRTGRDLTVDAEFPIGKRTYDHRPSFHPT